MGSSNAQVDIALGCMRPRQRSLEIQALHAGITRIANPSKSFLIYAKQKGYEIKTYAACCGIPSTCECYTETTDVCEQNTPEEPKNTL